MPLLKVQCNINLSNESKNSFTDQSSRMMSEILGKSENYVMCIVEDGKYIRFAGSAEPAAYVEFKSIGLPEDKTTPLAGSVCELISSTLSVAPERIYIEFANAQRHMWGWNNRTF